jgi:hypothetical protein
MSLRIEALEAAKEECLKAGRTFKLEKGKKHWKLFIDGCKNVLTISDTRAINNVRCDVRRTIRGV